MFPVVPRHAPKTQPKSEIGAGSGVGSARIAASMPSSEARDRAPNHQSGSTPGNGGTLKRRDHTVAVTCGISGNTLDTAKRNLVCDCGSLSQVFWSNMPNFAKSQGSSILDF